MTSIFNFFRQTIGTENSSSPLLSARQKIISFLVLFATALLAYRNGYDVRIPTDSFPFLLTFKRLGAAGLLHNFYDIGLAPVADFILFLLYKLFGPDTLGWFISAMLFHSINALLILLISLRLYAAFSLKPQFAPAFLTALLFLLSPYQTEVLLWTPRIINYVLAVTFILLACYYMIKYAQEEKSVDLILMHTFFIFAILSFETTLSFPAVPVCFLIVYRTLHRRPVRVGNILLTIILPQATLLFLYFLTCKLWLGDWILHYGAEAHLDFSLSLVAGNVIKYLAKFFLFYRYLPESRHEILHNVLHTDISNNYTMWVILSLAIFLTVLLFVKMFRSGKGNAMLLLFLSLAFLITLIPVINLDTTFVGAVFSDRYGYLPSVFFYLLLTGSIYMLFKKTAVYICSGLLALNCICLSQTTPLWNEASDYSKRLIHNFTPHMSEPNIFVLNMPDNCNWIMTYRNGFTSTAEFIYDKKIRSLEEVAGFYMSAINDSVRVSYDGSRTFHVESMPAKKSFFHRGIWAKSFETENYSVAFDSSLTSYTLTFKDTIPKDAAIFYVASDQWRKVNTTKGEK